MNREETTAGACVHCTLPVPAHRLPSQYCCDACETVHGALQANGLQAYYELREAAGAQPRRAFATAGQASQRGGFAEFDTPEFAALHVRAQGGEACVELVLDGVHCAACVWIVERLPAVLPGVIDSRLDLPRATASVRFRPSQVALSAVAKMLDRFGYPPHPARSPEGHSRTRESRELLTRVGVAWAISANVMVLSVSSYVGLFADMDAQTDSFLRVVSAAICLPSLLWCAKPFFAGVRASWLTKRLHMDVPIALGLVAGYAGGAVNVWRGAGPVYFDSVASLIFLLLAGRYLQLQQRRRSQQAAELLYSLAPQMAHKIDAATGLLGDVPVVALAAGDVVQVLAGEAFPVDGTVVVGQSSTDRSLLSGETRPVDVKPGDSVFAGTCNLGAPLQVRADQTGEATRVGQLLKAVDDQAARRAPIAALAESLVGHFVLAVLLLAAATALLWWHLDPTQALDNVVALLVVTCPCALGLATPLALHVALGRAASHGIFVKGGDALERLAKTGTLVFDKTGTLTEGKPVVLSHFGNKRAMELAAQLERFVAHPLAFAVAEAAPIRHDVQVDEVHHELGYGVRGRVDGCQVLVGKPDWVLAQTAHARNETPHCRLVDRELLRSLRLWAQYGQTPLLIALDGEPVAGLGLGDAVRRDARETLHYLRGLGWHVRILSGDDAGAVRAVAEQLDVPPDCAESGASPERKLAVIEKLTGNGTVVMVGDGVNDAAAMAAATVGISVHGGAEASLRAADLFLTQPGVRGVAMAVDGARATLRTIATNIWFSLGYNVVGVALAMSGHLSPLAAALLMPASSLLVVAASVRARSFRVFALPQKDARSTVVDESAPLSVQIAAQTGKMRAVRKGQAQGQGQEQGQAQARDGRGQP